MPILLVDIERAGYEDRQVVVSDIHFSIDPGELVGLIGPNGARKSTIIKAILGLLKEFVGEVHFLGGTRSYAYIPEHPILYDELTLLSPSNKV